MDGAPPNQKTLVNRKVLESGQRSRRAGASPGTDQILLGQLYRWRGSFEYEYESAVNTHGWCYVAGFAGPQIRPGSCKAAWSVPTATATATATTTATPRRTRVADAATVGCASSQGRGPRACPCRLRLAKVDGTIRR